MSEAARHRLSNRAVAARTFTVLGAVLALLSLTAVYVRYELLDTGTFHSTAQKLIQDPAIQQQIAQRAVDAVYENVDVPAELESRLPAAQKGLADPIAAALRGVSDRLATQLIATPAVQRVLVNAFAVSHGQLVRLLENKGKFARVQNGVVRLDLRQFVRTLTGQLGLPSDVADRIPDSAAEVTVVQSSDLRTGQRAIRVLDFLASWLWAFTLALWALAVYLVPGHRRRELRAIAISFTLVGVVVLLVRRVGGDYIVSSLVGSADVRPAVHDAYDIVTADLRSAAWTDVLAGLAALFGIWLVGPGRRAQESLHWLAPYLRRPGLTYGSFAGVWLVLLLWQPTVEFGRIRGLLLMLVLSAAGVEVVRRIAARRYPGAEARSFAEWLAVMRASLEHLWARAPHHAAGGSGGETVTAQLRSLALLHEAGQLSDAEFAAAKQRVLAV